MFETDGEPAVNRSSSGSSSGSSGTSSGSSHGIERRPDGFWASAEGIEPMGPYAKLSEAQDDLEGVVRCLAHLDDARYWTVTK